MGDLRRTWAFEKVAVGHLRLPIFSTRAGCALLVWHHRVTYQAVHRVLPPALASLSTVPAAQN